MKWSDPAHAQRCYPAPRPILTRVTPWVYLFPRRPSAPPALLSPPSRGPGEADFGPASLPALPRWHFFILEKMTSTPIRHRRRPSVILSRKWHTGVHKRDNTPCVHTCTRNDTWPWGQGPGQGSQPGGVLGAPGLTPGMSFIGLWSVNTQKNDITPPNLEVPGGANVIFRRPLAKSALKGGLLRKEMTFWHRGSRGGVLGVPPPGRGPVLAPRRPLIYITPAIRYQNPSTDVPPRRCGAISRKSQRRVRFWKWQVPVPKRGEPTSKRFSILTPRPPKSGTHVRKGVSWPRLVVIGTRPRRRETSVARPEVPEGGV